MWKDFFYFTKTQRRGILILILLIIGVNMIPFLLFPPTVEPLDEQVRTQRELTYNGFLTSVRKTEAKNWYTKKWYSKAYSPKEIRLTSFDPNTADSTTFSNLGLPPWMIRNILRYRSKSGKFRQAADFGKIYGLTEKQFQELHPYIRIAESFSRKDTINLRMEVKEKYDSIYKYPAGTLVNLNEADTTELKKIPGIGSSIARMIVNYRRKLGAFYCIEQLQEIHLKVDMLRPWLSVESNSTKRININTAGIEQLMRHPYINFAQAKAIVEYRKKKGKLKSFTQLSLYDEFSPADFDKLSHYISF